MYRKSLLMLGIAALLGALAVVVYWQGMPVAFTPGNLVVYRVGDGTRPLVNSGVAVYLDEYTTAGKLVRSIRLPTVLRGGNHPLIASGTATSEGALNRSPDGRFLAMVGYGVPLGGAEPVAHRSSGTIPRVVGVVDDRGRVDTSTVLTDFADWDNPRSAVTTDGTRFWVAGARGGVRYTTRGSTTSTRISKTLENVSVLAIYSDQLYVSSHARRSPIRLGTVGTGLPRTSGQTIVALPEFPIEGSPFAYFLTHLNDGAAGLSTLYVTDDTAQSGGVRKYALVEGYWILLGTIEGEHLRGLTGICDGNVVTLYATSGGDGSPAGGGELWSVTDRSGATGDPSALRWRSLASAGANQAFRGVALAPESGSPRVDISGKGKGNGNEAGQKPPGG